MSQSRNKAESRGCVKSGGREYVTQAVCAQRLGISRPSLCEDTKKGKYTRVKLPEYKGEWYDWEITRALFAKQRKNPKSGGSKEKKDAAVFGLKSKVTDPTTTVPSDEIKDVIMPEVPNGELLMQFDPESPENADCWEVDETGEFLYVPGTQKHYVDWKKTIDKNMANIRYQQFLQKQGELIPKADVVQTLSLIFPPITSAVMQIPDRFASRLGGRLEELIGRSMTNEERTLFKSVLEDEAEQIARNFQDVVEKTLNE